MDVFFLCLSIDVPHNVMVQTKQTVFKRYLWQPRTQGLRSGGIKSLGTRLGIVSLEQVYEN